jgi:peptidoglycan/LPS O-acetylase OafA/YrhL
MTTDQFSPLAAASRRAPSEPVALTSLGHLPVLDGLRGVAVVAVVAFHAHWLIGGYLGVDVFFVLSGFLITRLLLAEHDRTGRIDLRRFWSRRARRLLPALLIVIAVAAVGERARGRLDGPAGGRIDVIGGLTYTTNWLRLRSGAGYWSAFGGPSLLDHTWSLAIEEQFYVLWPLLVVGLLRAVRRRSARFAVLLVTTALAATWSIVAFSRSHDASRVYMGTDTRAVALVAGATVAALLAWRGALRSRAVNALALLSAGALVEMFANLSGTALRTYRGGLLVCSLATALVIAATATTVAPRLARPLTLRALRYLGERSYGIYLWHWPVMVGFGVAKAPLSASWRRVGAIAITLVVAEVSYRIVEQPIRRRGLAVFGSRWRPLLGAAVVTTVSLMAVLVPRGGAVPASAVPLPVLPTTSPTASSPPSTSTLASIATSTASADLSASSVQTSTASADVSASSVQTSTTAGPSAGDSVPPSSVAPLVLPVAPPADRPARVLFVGDSVAWFLGIQAEADAARMDIEVTNAAVPACPPTHHPLRRRAKQGVVPLVFDKQCQDTVNGYRALAERIRPDVVLVNFGASLLDENEIAPGEWYAPCTAEFDAWYQNEIRTISADLGSTGAPVFWATQAYYRGEVTAHTPVLDDQIDCENSTAAEVASHGGGALGLVRLGEWACPRRSCLDKRDGIELRADGTHFMDAAAALANVFVLSQVFSPPPWQR